MMKKLLLIATMLWGVAYGQSTVYVRGDTTRIQKIGGNATLIVENATRNVTNGVMTNAGGGKTQFSAPSSVPLLDSVWREPGKDSLFWRKAGTRYAVKDSIGSGGGGTATPDSLLSRFNQIPEHGIVFGSTDTLVVVTDSYGSGTGAASPSTDGYVQKLVIKLGSPILSLYAVSGSTVMKRTPVDYNGTANLLDRLPGLPSGGSDKKLMIIAMGLNDVGQTAAAYSVANFKTDYDSAIHYLTTTKGWNPRKILIVSPYYIGQAGYNAYSVITGNAAATPARHRDMVYVSKQVAQRWGTLWWDAYNDQLQNDTTLMNVDAIHANTPGHAYLSKAGFNYIAGASQASNWSVSINGKVFTAKGALNTGLSTTTPIQVILGGNYYSTPGTPEFSTKFVTYKDANANNTSGLGVSTDGQEYHTFGNHNLYSLAVRVATFSGTLNNLFNTLEIAKTGTGSTQNLKLDHSQSYAAPGNETYISYESVSTELGRHASYYDGTGFGNKTYVHSGSVLQVATTIKGNMTMGFGGLTSPTSWVDIAAGTSAIAAFGLNSGPDLSSPLAGKFYYNGTRLGFSPSTTIKRFALTNDAAPSNGQIPIGNGTDYTVANISSSAGTVGITNSSGGINLDIPTTVLDADNYTPTVTGSANYASSASVTGKYIRVKNFIEVTIQGSVTATAGGSAVIFEATLPVASNFTATTDLIGHGIATYAGSAEIAFCSGSIGNDRVVISTSTIASTNDRSFSVSFKYEVK